MSGSATGTESTSVPAESAAPTRATVFHCPYCGEEDLRPHEASHGAWSCRDCRRVFAVSFLGVLGTEGFS